MTKYKVFSGPYFRAFGLNTERYEVFSPNAGKYGSEKTPCLDTFFAVILNIDWVLNVTLKSIFDLLFSENLWFSDFERQKYHPCTIFYLIIIFLSKREIWFLVADNKESINGLTQEFNSSEAANGGVL